MMNGVASLHHSSFMVHRSELEAMKGVEPLSFGLQDRRSVIQLSYIAMRIGGLGGIQTLAGSLQDFYAVVTSPARNIYHLSSADVRCLLFAQYAAGAPLIDQ